MTDVPVIEGELIDVAPTVPQAFTEQAPGAISPYVPRPQGGLNPNQYPNDITPLVESRGPSSAFDSSTPNFVQVPPQDWTPEIRELNDRIADDLERSGLDAARAETARANARRNRGRNPASGLNDVLEDGLIGLAGAATDYLGIPTDPADFARIATDLGLGAVRGLFGSDDSTTLTGIGDPAYFGGQSPGVLYRITLRTFSFNDEGVKNSNNHVTEQRGPITVFRTNTGSSAPESGFNTVRVLGSTDFKDYKRADRVELFFENVNIERVDGQPDTGGNIEGEPVPVGNPGNNNRQRDFTDPNSPGVPGIGLPRPSLPNLPNIGNPFGSQPETNPDTDPLPPGIDSPALPTLPGVPNLPDFGGDSGSGEGESGEEQISCCEKIDQIHGYFQSSGAAAWDAGECDGAAVADPWLGAGLSGIYRALESITRAVDAIHADTKCPPEISTAGPMYWEMKVGEIPQLVVLLKRSDEISSSRWSFHIPHPQVAIDRNYQFSFPEFIKGDTLCTCTLKDNSKIVVNALNEAEGQKIIDYCLSLVEPSFALGHRIVFSKTNRNLASYPVEACYLKAYEGHLDKAPRWAKSLVD